MSLTNNNTYTGATVINNAGAVLTGGGRLSGTTSVTINGYVGQQVGVLNLENALAGANGDRVNNSAAVTLNGGLISSLVPITGTANEAFGNLTVKGFGTLFNAQFNGGLGSAAMAFNNVSRFDNFSTLYLGGPGTGGSFKVTFATGLAATGGSGQTAEIVPWVGGDRGALDSTNFAINPTGFAETLHRYDATNGLIALNPTSSPDFQLLAPTTRSTADSPPGITRSPAVRWR